jgi:hypothetical protein
MRIEPNHQRLVGMGGLYVGPVTKNIAKKQESGPALLVDAVQTPSLHGSNARSRSSSMRSISAAMIARHRTIAP